MQIHRRPPARRRLTPAEHACLQKISADQPVSWSRLLTLEAMGWITLAPDRRAKLTRKGLRALDSGWFDRS